MPSTKPGGAKKKMVKAPALKEAMLKEVTTAQKAATRKCTTWGNEPSEMAAQTLVGHTHTCMPPLPLLFIANGFGRQYFYISHR
jgi:hypothetical protein